MPFSRRNEPPSIQPSMWGQRCTMGYPFIAGWWLGAPPLRKPPYPSISIHIQRFQHGFQPRSHFYGKNRRKRLNKYLLNVSFFNSISLADEQTDPNQTQICGIISQSKNHQRFKNLASIRDIQKSARDLHSQWRWSWWWIFPVFVVVMQLLLW